MILKWMVKNARIGYSYARAGRITTVKTEYGTTQYEYDLLDRLTEESIKKGWDKITN